MQITARTTIEADFKPVPAVAKCCAIIRLLDANMAAGLSLAVISEQLDITKSHCLQILRTLEAEGWVQHDAQRRRYLLADKMLLDVAALAGGSDTGSRQAAIVQRLTAQLGLPCVLTRINRDGSFTSVAKAEPDGDLLVMSPLGFRFPADAPAQMRARLAAYPAERVDALLAQVELTRYTAETLMDAAAIRREIAATRKRGYAVGRMEYQPGIMSIAAAVIDTRGAPRMILQCSSTREAIMPRIDEIGSAVMAASEAIAQCA